MIARLSRLVVALAIVLAIAWWVVSRLHAYGAAGDCTPQQIDGQCGMSTWLGDVYGTAAALAIIGIGLVVITLVYRRHERNIDARTRPAISPPTETGS